MKKLFTLFVAALFCATMFADTKSVYLKLSSAWAGFPAKYAVYYYKDGVGDGWTNFMTEVQNEENVYTTTIPTEGYDKIIFVRFNSTKESTGNWDDKWSQTIDLDYPMTVKDFFTVTSGGDGSECNGSWSVYGLPYVQLAGTMTDWATNAKEMVPATNKLTASVTVTLDVQTYEFKIVSDGSYLSLNSGKEGEHFKVSRQWNHADKVNLINVGDNFDLVADAAGEYTFTWTFADSTLVVTFPELPTVAIVGNFAGDDSWWVPVTGNNIMTPDGEGKTASVTFENLEEREYEMKVWVNGTYLTKVGEYGPYQIKRDNYDIKDVNANVTENNMKLMADKTGNYTFTWTYATRNLVVTFPPQGPSTAIDNNEVSAKAVKRIVNGQLFIEKNGKTFNALGAEVK